MLTKVRGRFTGVNGEVAIAEDVEDSRVNVTIAMATVESGNATRDDHIKSAELFDVEGSRTRRSAAPTRLERSRRDRPWRPHHPRHHPQVPLHVSFEGHARDPWGGDRAFFSARAKVNREDFGITWNVALEAGGLLVSKEIQIEIDLETVLRTD